MFSLTQQELCPASEDEVEAEADAPLGDARIGRVGEAADVVDLKHLEDVVDAHDQFEVGLVGHDVRPLGQLPQVRAQTVFGERGVVLRRQMAPEALEGHILAELQSAQERDAVEEFARQVPGEVELEVAVVDELHVLHEVERPLVLEERRVDGRQTEHEVGRAVPCRPRHEAHVEMSPRGEPQSLVGLELRGVVAILPAQESLQAHGVAERELGRVEVDLDAMLLRVDVALARAVVERGRELRGADARDGRAVEGEEGERARGAVGLGLELEGRGQSIVRLPREVERLAVEEIHLLGLLRLHGHEDIVLVVLQVAVGGRLHVLGRFEADGAHGKLVGLVFRLVERVGQFAVIVVVARLRAVGVVALAKPMGGELGRGAGRGPEADAIDEVARDDGVDRSDVDLAASLRGRLDEVFGHGLDADHDPLEPARFAHLLDKLLHVGLAMRQGRASVFGPESLVARLGLRLIDGRGMAAEEAVVDGVEGIVVEARGAHDHGSLDQARQLELGHHVVRGQGPVAIGQPLKLLLEADGLDEVDARAVGHLHDASADVERGVVEDVELAAEAEVLVVGRHKLEADATVARHGHGILDIEMVETDGCRSYGRGESLLEERDLVVVEVDVAEDVLGHGVEDVARLYEFGDAPRGLSAHEVARGGGVATVEMGRGRLIDRDGEDKLVVVLRDLHLSEQPGRGGEEASLQFLGRDVVDGHGDLLVLVVLVEVVALEVGALLGGYDTAHELHGGVALALVALLALGLDGDLGQLGVGGREADDEVSRRGAARDADALRAVADGGDAQHVALAPGQGEASLGVGREGRRLVGILEGGMGEGVERDGIHHHATDALGEGREGRRPEHRECEREGLSRSPHRLRSHPFRGWRSSA